MTMIFRDRVYRLRINTIEFDKLDIDFSIKKTLRAEPNAAKITVKNLSPANRAAIEQLNLYDPKRVGTTKTSTSPTGTTTTTTTVTTPPAAGSAAESAKTSGTSARNRGANRAPKRGRIPVELEAGYVTTGKHLIFRGDLRRALTTNDTDGTFTTEIEGEDGGRSTLSSRVNEAFPPGTTAVQVVRACAEAMGVGVGNILTAKGALQGKVFKHGTVLTGQAGAELAGVLRRLGLSYSIQNGVLAFRAAGKGLTPTGFVLSSETGLVGSPARDASGLVVATTLLLPSVAPGALIDLQSEQYRGSYMVQEVEYSGSTYGDEWYSTLELVPY